jgi:hypothetical protein
MESGLTQFGIDELARQGVDVTGLTVGYPPTDDMRIRLGIQDDVDPGALPDPVSAAQVAEGMATTLDPQAAALNAGSMDPAAVAGAMNAVPAAAPVTQEQLTAPKSGGLGDMLFGPQEATDQFSNLNRQQRMMLAFGAIKDAGFALQGKEGSAFSSTLKAINDQIDMGRKAKAVEQQREIMQSALGPVAGGETFDGKRLKLQQALAAGAIQAPEFTAMMAEIARQEQAQAAAIGGSSQAATQLEDVNRLLNLIDSDPKMTTGVMGSLLSYIPGTAANIAEGLATTLRSNLALEALKSLKATGATMGALNEKEFNALETQLTNLDLSKGPETAKIALKRIQTTYQNLIADAFRDAEEQAAAGNPNGQRALDGLLRIFGSKPSWTADAGPVVPSGGSTDPAEPLSDEDLDNLYPPTTN